MVYITKVLLIKLDKIESDFKVVHHLSTNHAFKEIHADPLKLSIDYTQNHMKRFKGIAQAWHISALLLYIACIMYLAT